eukprot:scaffold6751_cov188-Skeletonema_menzelii.AAC.3
MELALPYQDLPRSQILKGPNQTLPDLVPSPTLGTSHIEYQLSQQLNNFAYQLQKSKPIIAIMMASNQQAAP